jgi:hypothetical protein
MTKQTKEIAKVKKLPAKIKKQKKAVTSTDLIELAVNKDYDLERMQRLIDMRDKEEARQAEKEFYRHFALLQADLQPVARNKKGYTNNYSTLAQMKRSVDKKVSDHGFSYYWERSKIDRQTNWMESAFVLVGHGHTRRSVAEGPIVIPAANNQTGETRMNPLQAIQATQYSMMDGLGISSDDDDVDGAGKVAGTVRVEVVREETVNRKTSKELETARAALNETFGKMSKSKLYGGDELIALQKAGKANVDDGDATQVYALKVAWDKDLDQRKRKEAHK